MGTRQTRGRRRYNPDHVQKVLQTVLMVLLVVALCILSLIHIWTLPTT